MKLWVDDLRKPPAGYVWVKSVAEAKEYILSSELFTSGMTDNLRKVSRFVIDLIDVDHDAGDYAKFGGDYIRLLDWLEATGRNYPIRIHTMNPVGAANMRRVIQRNGWKEVF